MKCAVCHHVVEGDTPHHCPRCGEASFIGETRAEHMQVIPPPPPDCPSFGEFIAEGYPADQYPPSWCKPAKKGELAKRDAWVKRHPKAKAKTSNVVAESDTIDPPHAAPAPETHAAIAVEATKVLEAMVADPHVSALLPETTAAVTQALASLKQEPPAAPVHAADPVHVAEHETHDAPSVPEHVIDAAAAEMNAQPEPAVTTPAPAPDDASPPVEHHEEPVAPAADPAPASNETTAPHEGANEGTRT